MKKIFILGLVLLFLCSFTFANIEDNIVHYWDFEDTSDPTFDYFGYWNLSVIEGDQVTDEISSDSKLGNYAWDLKDASRCEEGVGNKLPTNGTLSFWVKMDNLQPQGVATNSMFMGTERDQTKGRAFLLWIAISLNDNPRARVQSYNDYTDNGVSATINTYHMYSIIWNTSSYRVLWDNVQAEVGSYGSFLDWNTTDEVPFCIGSLANEDNDGMDGRLDDIAIWDRELSTTEISELYNSGSGYNISKSKSSFIFPTPVDGNRNNTQVIINVSCLEGNVSLWFDNNTNPITLIDGGNKPSPFSWTTNVTTEGTYYYKASCSEDIINSSIRSWTYDTSSPNIIINDNNFFADDNSSSLSRIQTNKNLNITLTDNNDLYGFEINISQYGITYYYNSSESLSGVSYNINNYVNFSNWTLGEYNSSITVSDQHTDEEIKYYLTKTEKSKIEFHTEEGNHIWMTTSTSSTTKTVKSIDRYSLEFTFDNKFQSDKVIDLYSDNKINYLKDSRYKGHFVIWNSKIKKGNWVDFEGEKINPLIQKVTDYHYRLTFKNADSTLKFNSIGGLNTNTKNYKFNLTNVYPFNPAIYVSNYLDWNYYGEYNLNESINLNITEINNILYQDCICDGCIISGSNCRIPIKFYSKLNSKLKVNLINTTYSYGIDNCSNSFNIPSNATALNLTFYNENDIPINITFSSYINYFLSNYSQDNLIINKENYCVYPNWFNLTVDQQIEYSYDSTIYDYFLDDYLFNNITKNLNLYSQNGTTQVLFSVLDRGTKLANAYIHILKYDVGSNLYTTTEILKTDTQGQAIGNIILGTTFYNFLVYYEGELVYTENAVKLISSTRTFNINLLGVDWLDEFGTSIGTNTNLYFNNATYNFVFTWSDSTGAVHYGCLEVAKINTTGTYVLYDNCSQTTSGTIVYNILPLNNGTEYIGTAYFKYDNENIIERIVYKVSDIKSFFNERPEESLFIGFLFILVLFLIGIPQPAISIVLMGLGVIIAWMMGLWSLVITDMGAIIVLIFIQLYLAGRQNQ